jgi:hypothetical protein
MRPAFALILSLFSLTCCITSQAISQTDTLTTGWIRSADALQAHTIKTVDDLQNGFEKYADKMQRHWIKQEQKLAAIIQVKDSAAAAQMGLTLQSYMNSWECRMASPDSLLAATGLGPYLSRIDSLTGALHFLKTKAGGTPEQIIKMLEPLKALKARMGLMQEYSEWLNERKNSWQALLGLNGFSNDLMPPAFRQLAAEAANYKAQWMAWKETLNDPAKLEAEALKWLQKLPAFKEFMSRNGELARLFAPPGGTGGANTSQALAGLQTRQGLMQTLQSRFGSLQQANQAFNQQLQAGMSQLSQAQQQLTNLGSQLVSGSIGNSNLTPYQQESADLKTKSFGRRLEFGWNLQTGVRVQNFPSVNDLGLSLGYKVNPKSVIGIGVAYKFALGSIQKIQFTHEGIGLRSFADLRISSPKAKMFSNIWLSGGFEMNYWQRFDNLPPIGARSAPQAWQRSGLIGMTKKMKMGKREGKMQVLWDFLNPQPSGSMPFQIRWGTSF